MSDDLPGAQSFFSIPPVGNGLPMSINSFSFQYTLHASMNQLPVTATVRFIGIGPLVNFITAEYGKVVIPDLATGTVIQSVTLDEKIVVPVPMDTTVSPTMSAGMPRARARLDAPRTRNSPPPLNTSRPRRSLPP